MRFFNASRDATAYWSKQKANAAAARRLLVGRLEASDTPGSTILATILASCTDDKLCRSAACPVCGLAFQRAIEAGVHTFLRVPSNELRGRMTALTVVPKLGCVEPGKLTVSSNQGVRDSIQSTLRALNLPSSITGIETSFNEDETGTFEPHWCTHGHVLQLDWMSEAQKEKVREAYPPTKFTKRPVKIVELDGDARGTRYPFKWSRGRRVSFLNKDHPTRSPFRDTKSRSLRARHSAALALIEHDLGFRRRLLIHEIDEGVFWKHMAQSGWARDGP